MPRSKRPSCAGPSLYMWLDWFVPLPALKNENSPAISSVDLWCVTVYGPANTAQASPQKQSQLAKNTEFSAEYQAIAYALQSDAQLVFVDRSADNLRPPPAGQSGLFAVRRRAQVQAVGDEISHILHGSDQRRRNLLCTADAAERRR